MYYIFVMYTHSVCTSRGLSYLEGGATCSAPSLLRLRLMIRKVRTNDHHPHPINLTAVTAVLAIFFFFLTGVGSSEAALVPGLNVPYGMRFEGFREGVDGEGKMTGSGPGWRKMGTKKDKQFCFASLPGAGGKEFMGQVGISILGTGGTGGDT